MAQTLTRLLAAILIVMCASAAIPAAADKKYLDDLRKAVERGEIKSLSIVLNDVRTKLPGEVIGIGIERERGRWIYEFRVLDAKGRMFEVYVDPKSSEIVKIEDK